MNIKDVTGLSGAKPVDPSKGNTNAPPKQDSKASSLAAGTGDQLTLTSVGQALVGAAEESAPVDRERVDAIRNALADGSYEIDSARLAAKLLRMDRDLL
jgi:negative regulator of flagellin synthesis FlgM